jgi:hypothetical protein
LSLGWYIPADYGWLPQRKKIPLRSILASSYDPEIYMPRYPTHHHLKIVFVTAHQCITLFVPARLKLPLKILFFVTAGAYSNMKLYAAVLVAVMLITGTANTLTKKLQNKTMAPGLSNVPHEFSHPWFQTWIMVQIIYCVGW